MFTDERESRTPSSEPYILENAPDDPFDSLVEVLPFRSLLVGKVADVDRRTEGGFVRGSAKIEGTAEDQGRVLGIEFQNENLVAIEHGEASTVIPVAKMSFVIALFLSAILKMETLSKRKLFGVVCAMVSIILLSQA